MRRQKAYSQWYFQFDENKSFLSNEKVYPMLKSQISIEIQKEMKSYRAASPFG